MKIVAIHTGLFPDASRVADALSRIEPAHPVVRIDLTRPDMGEGDWDAALVAILASDLAVTL